MIQLPAHSLLAAAQTQLDAWQQAIDGLPAYPDRVAAAKTQFPNRNKATNPTFANVRLTLGAMCSGARRCAYCEDSVADEVEHMRPKDLYPEQVFRWDNYVYACGSCNGPKNNRFAVVIAGQTVTTPVSRARGAAIVPPAAGAYALLDPRVEDPLRFLHLDLLGTFHFTPKLRLAPADRARAIYTIDLLALNTRDFLPQARGEAYVSYRARLGEYCQRKANGVPQQQLDVLTHAIRRMQHPTVWREMQRQQARIPELQALFSAAPEALNW